MNDFSPQILDGHVSSKVIKKKHPQQNSCMSVYLSAQIVTPIGIKTTGGII